MGFWGQSLITGLVGMVELSWYDIFYQNVPNVFTSICVFKCIPLECFHTCTKETSHASDYNNTE